MLGDLTIVMVSALTSEVSRSSEQINCFAEITRFTRGKIAWPGRCAFELD